MSVIQSLKISRYPCLLVRCLVVGGLAAVLSESNAASITYTVTNLSLGGRHSEANAVNASGQVTGLGFVPDNSTFHAFRYTADGIQDLGTLGGETSSGNAINENGQVTGQSRVTPPTIRENIQHAFIYSGTKMQDLGSLGGSTSTGTAINSNEQVTGFSFLSGNTQYHAFRYNRGVMEDLGTLGGENSEATAINDNGQVGGVSDTVTAFQRHAFLYSGTTMKYLGSLGADSYLKAINSSGQATGISASHAFRYSDGQLQDLGTLGGTGSNGIGINAKGQVTGYSDTAVKNVIHAFLHDGIGMTMQDLGTLGNAPETTSSFATAINENGQVVGYARNLSTGVQTAFLWSASEGMIDLNTRLNDAPAGLHIDSAVGLSDTGFIIAQSNVGAVLLSPVQPTTPPTAPAVGPITANDPVAVGTPVTTSASFTDINTGDSHTATWAWENNGTSPGTVTEANGVGTVTGTGIYTAAGVYTVGVTVTDSSSLSTTISRQVVVYDPSAGFVTGGGWIMSPPGAYKADPLLSGYATFGFVSRYVKGATKPTGNTEFQFQAARLLFQSSNYDWLVVSGARAQYKGVGTINGTGNYQFLLTAVDGDIKGGGGKDRFRIKIWHFDDATQADVADYDNQLDSSTIGTTSEGTVIGGGSITIHAR